MDKAAVLNALKQVPYPGYSRDIVSFGIVKDIAVGDDGGVLVNIAVTTGDASIPERLRASATAALSALASATGGKVEVRVTQNAAPGNAAPAAAAPAPAAAAPVPAPIPGVRRVLAVASGKGGVGKSTVAVNLACALAVRLGPGRVGLLDCDIYGPSIPLMTGLSGQRPEATGDGDAIEPLEKFGVKLMSLGFLIDDDAPVIWRGPMILKTIRQFVTQVAWDGLDVLVVDLPPGTGDAPLSLAQTVVLDGALIVTTPQTAAAAVARRGAELFNRLGVPILGVVENMSYLELPGGGRQEVFGVGGGVAVARALGVAVLAQVPLDIAVREGGDAGLPVVVAQPQSHAAREFARLAEAVA
jgi:ATP-binding protein involved in chromosome partitioning